MVKAPGKRGIWFKYFPYFTSKTYVVGTNLMRLNEAILISTHNICFCGGIRKISICFD